MKMKNDLLDWLGTIIPALLTILALISYLSNFPHNVTVALLISFFILRALFAKRMND
jgi:hypothetical protein